MLLILSTHNILVVRVCFILRVVFCDGPACKCKRKSGWTSKPSYDWNVFVVFVCVGLVLLFGSNIFHVEINWFRCFSKSIYVCGCEKKERTWCTMWKSFWNKVLDFCCLHWTTIIIIVYSLIFIAIFFLNWKIVPINDYMHVWYYGRWTFILKKLSLQIKFS